VRFVAELAFCASQLLHQVDENESRVQVLNSKTIVKTPQPTSPYHMAYLGAVSNGDVASAQRMVDPHRERLSQSDVKIHLNGTTPPTPLLTFVWSTFMLVRFVCTAVVTLPQAGCKHWRH
jgi:hypothetical protein